MRLRDAVEIAGIDAPLDAVVAPHRHARRPLIDIARRDHLRLGRQVEPKLQRMRGLAFMRHLAVQHAAPRRHPLHVSGAQDAIGAGMVAMVQRAVEHQRHGLHAAMRMRLETARRREPIFRQTQERRLRREIVAMQDHALALHLLTGARLDRMLDTIGFTFHAVLHAQRLLQR